METVTVSRSIPAESEQIRAEMENLEAFMEAAGFDEVTVDGDQFTIENSVGMLTIDLTLRVVETDAALAYEQVDGIFESMRTSYALQPTDGRTTVTCETAFELDVSLVGPVLDSTVISRQRRKELNAQLDFLEQTAGEA